ncbi:MAG TPA: replication initiation protein, partial [Candidatus Limnocylindria bacterium]|nr:replication initiation protein [Candidatus Limnocylindria bacterium]
MTARPLFCHADFALPTFLMQSRSIAPHGQALVTKHNKLIQARFALSLQEKRLILWLVSAIRPGDTDFHSYRVSVRALAELLGLEKN